MSNNVYDLPSNLPKPVDDGQTDHLRGHAIPNINLTATTGHDLALTEIFAKPSVLFIYPRAGSPLEPNVDPELWDTIPGARGCTPHSCKFRDLHAEFKALGVNIYGASIQSPVVQKEFVERNHIPFPILSDSQYKLTESLKLPTFDFAGERLIKRMAFYIEDNKIKKVFYPVFPPDKNADEVLAWLKTL
ncbi:peroxiredoxin [Bdellovibrio sp. qaytius]|nr:peroxiredoxin [Bdellovibrio sp. qaytius]